MAFRLIFPTTADEALEALAGAAGEAAVLAGGTDLLPDIDRGVETASTVVSLNRLPWRELDWQGDRLRIGSVTPLAEIEADARVKGRLPGLHSAVRAVGGVALRGRATLGGNIVRAAPASDLLPILLALDAEVHILGRNGSRVEALDRFLRGSRETGLARGELVRAVECPARASAYLWQRVRPANDISQVGVAAARAAEGRWSLAVGGVLPRPLRLSESERLLDGARPSAERVREAAERASRDAPFATDKRATEEYRRHLVRILVTRAVGAVARMRSP